MDSQLCRDFLQQFESFGFKVNWLLLKIGFEGWNNLPRIISSNTIIEYAEKCLEKGENKPDLLVRIIDSIDEYEFQNALDELSKEEKTDPYIQYRKLRAFVVFSIIETLPNDCFDALLELTELWVSLGMPEDCPLFIQGRNNIYTPKAFYTKSNYNTVLMKTKDWIEKEKREIIKEENHSFFQKSGKNRLIN